MTELFVEKASGVPIVFIVVVLMAIVIMIVMNVYAEKKDERIYFGGIILLLGAILGIFFVFMSEKDYYYLQITNDTAYEELLKDYNIVNQYDNKIYKCTKKEKGAE